MYGVPSILPTLFDWSFWVPFFFRIFLAYHLYREAKRLMADTPALADSGNDAPTPKARKTLAWMLMGLSFLFFIGLGVQIIATFTAIAYLVRLWHLKKNDGKDAAKEGVEELLFLSALVSFSLVFLGPGPYAIDLPL